jgi:hypothetical protein
VEGWMLVSDICRHPENLVLRTRVGFENPTYAQMPSESFQTASGFGNKYCISMHYILMGMK